LSAFQGAVPSGSSPPTLSAVSVLPLPPPFPLPVPLAVPLPVPLPRSV